MLPSTLERQLRAQRLAGQLPTGRPGGGRASAHFEAKHLANVILGLAGAEPSDAPAAAEALRSIPLDGAANWSPDWPEPLPTFEDQIEYAISAMAEAYRQGDGIKIASYLGAEISLCLNPRQAAITFGPVGILYSIKAAPVVVLRRMTFLSGAPIVAAGELLADTIKHIGPPKAVPFFAEPQPAKAGAEQENAGNLRQEAPAS